MPLDFFREETPMAVDEDLLPEPAPTIDEKAIRKQAKWRSYFCPGAGFALLGWNRAGWLTYIPAFGAVWAFGALFLSPGKIWLWISISLAGMSLVTWIAEQLAVKSASIPAVREGLLKRRYGLLALFGWGSTLIVLVVFFVFCSLARIFGNGMSPALLDGEWVCSNKWVKDELLKPGRVIVFRASKRSVLGQEGDLMIGRILAKEGDTISLRDQRFLVNGVPGPRVLRLGFQQFSLDIPQSPGTWTVPQNSFFIVQDNAPSGFDSRVVSWVAREEVVSTTLYAISGRGWFREVE
jgi:signal peptidase I